jgi:hypothetical protein
MIATRRPQPTAGQMNQARQPPRLHGVRTMRQFLDYVETGRCGAEPKYVPATDRRILALLDAMRR